MNKYCIAEPDNTRRRIGAGNDFWVQIIFIKFFERLWIFISKNRQVPVWEKANLSLEEAADYFGIGINKLRDMTNEQDCKFVLWNGNKRMIKRKVFEKYLEESFSI